MSIIANALKKRITWQQAAQQIGAWFQQVGNRVISDPVISQAVNELNTVVKQGASNALALADTEIGAHLGDAVDATDVAVDALLAKVLGPGAVMATPLVNSGVKQLFNTLHDALHAKELEWQAKLQPVAAPASTK